MNINTFYFHFRDKLWESSSITKLKFNWPSWVHRE